MSRDYHLGEESLIWDEGGAHGGGRMKRVQRYNK